MLINLMRTMGIAFLMTLVVEFFVILLLTKESERKAVTWLVFLLANLLTNPAAVYLATLGHSYLTFLPDLVIQIPIEIAVVIVEWIVYKGYLSRPLLCAIAANLCSWGVGIMYNRLF